METPLSLRSYCQQQALENLSNLPEEVLEGLVDALRKKRLAITYPAVLHRNCLWEEHEDEYECYINFLRLVLRILKELDQSSLEIYKLLIPKIRYRIIYTFLIKAMWKLRESNKEKYTDPHGALPEPHIYEERKDTDILWQGLCQIEIDRRLCWDKICDIPNSNTPLNSGKPTLKETIALMETLLRWVDLDPENEELWCSEEFDLPVYAFGLGFDRSQSIAFLEILDRIDTSAGAISGTYATDAFTGAISGAYASVVPRARDYFDIAALPLYTRVDYIYTPSSHSIRVEVNMDPTKKIEYSYYHNDGYYVSPYVFK
jgi:hypothetical protein